MHTQTAKHLLFCQKEIALPSISKQTDFTHVAERCSGSSCNVKPLKPNQRNCFNAFGVWGVILSSRCSTFSHEEWRNAIRLNKQRSPLKVNTTVDPLLVARASSRCCQFDEFLSPKTMRAHKHHRLVLTGKRHWEACGVPNCPRAGLTLFTGRRLLTYSFLVLLEVFPHFIRRGVKLSRSVTRVRATLPA